MLITEDSVLQVVLELMNKTFQHKAEWNYDNNRFYLVLPNRMTISIAKRDAERIGFRILAGTNEVIGELQVSPGDSKYVHVQQLYNAVEQYSSKRILNEILESINKPGILGRGMPVYLSGSWSSTSTLPVAPILPPKPTATEATLFFQKIAGRWLYHMPNAQETVEIDSDGNFFGKGEPTPKFRLSLLACNDDLSTVELAKSHPDGRMHQVEVLAIGEAQMSGVAKHDQHPVKYTRV